MMPNKEQIEIIAREPREFFEPLKFISIRVLGKLELIEQLQQLHPYQSISVATRINELYAEIDDLKNQRLDVIELIQTCAKREQHKKILMNRFVELISIEAIADQMDLGYRDIQKRLQRALRAFQLGVMAKYNSSQNTLA